MKAQHASLSFSAVLRWISAPRIAISLAAIFLLSLPAAVNAKTDKKDPAPTADAAATRAEAAPDDPNQLPHVKPKPTLPTDTDTKGEPDPFAEPAKEGDQPKKKPITEIDPFAEPPKKKAPADATDKKPGTDTDTDKTVAPNLLPGMTAPGKRPDKANPFLDDMKGPPPKAGELPKDKDTDKTPAKTPSADTNPKGPITTDIPSDTKSTEPAPTPGAAELKQGQDLLEAGKYEEAIEPLKKAIKLTPTEAVPHYSLGVAYRMLERYDDAISELSEAIKLDPDLGDAFLRRGVCWLNKDEFGLAQADFEDAAGVNFNDPRPLTWKGIALVRQGLIRDAVNVYSQALRYDNHYSLAHVNRGLAYIALKEYEKAAADFEQAIRSNPKDATLYYRRGVAQAGMANWAAAAKSYSEAIRLDPKYGEAFRNRAAAYRNLGDATKAQADSAQWQQLKAAAAQATAEQKTAAHSTANVQR